MKNIGKVRNQGIEFTLNTTNIKTVISRGPVTSI